MSEIAAYLTNEDNYEYRNTVLNANTINVNSTIGIPAFIAFSFGVRFLLFTKISIDNVMKPSIKVSAKWTPTFSLNPSVMEIELMRNVPAIIIVKKYFVIKPYLGSCFINMPLYVNYLFSNINFNIIFDKEQK